MSYWIKSWRGYCDLLAHVSWKCWLSVDMLTSTCMFSSKLVRFIVGGGGGGGVGQDY